MKPSQLLITLSLLLASIAAGAQTAQTYYRACCTSEPERHGCGISIWYESENAAHEAGARHARMSSGHTWTLESTTR